MTEFIQTPDQFQEIESIAQLRSYFERGGKEALITDPANIERALQGKTGTRIVP